VEDKLKIVKGILGWLFAVALAFIYVMVMQLLISFLFMSYLHMNIETMLYVSIAAAAITGIIYPIVKHKK